MVVYCALCKVEQSPLSEVSFHSLPSDPGTREKWLHIIGKKNVKRLYVCSDHFRPDDYKELCDRPLLKKGAVPLPMSPIEFVIVTENNEMSCDDSISKIKKELLEISEEREKNDALSRLIPPEFVSKTENDKMNCNDSTSRIKNELLEINGERENVENLAKKTLQMPSTSSEEIKSDSVKTQKRNKKSCNISSTLGKKRCLLQKYGHFSREDFKDDITWNHFLSTIEGLRKDKEVLERQNKRFRTKIKAYKELIKELTDRKLWTEVPDMC